MEIVEILDVDVTHHVTHVVAKYFTVLIILNRYTYMFRKEGFDMPENRGCGCGFGFGDDCCTWIILLIIIFCCCGGNRRNGCC